MDLLGVDFLIDSKDPSKIYCIDVNLFPSYTGFENVSEVMGKLILKKCGFFLVSFQKTQIIYYHGNHHSSEKNTKLINLRRNYDSKSEE